MPYFKIGIRGFYKTIQVIHIKLFHKNLINNLDHTVELEELLRRFMF